MAQGAETVRLSDEVDGEGAVQTGAGGPSSARSLLLTVLGELVLPGQAPVWTSALLHVLRGVGLEERTARQAIARGATAGWIEGERQGREVRWAITEDGVQSIAERSRSKLSMNSSQKSWEEDWLIIFVTVPLAQKTVRKRLYSALSWAGFGNPIAGIWVSPHCERASEARRIIRDLDLQDSAIGFVGSTLSVGLSSEEIVRRAWDLGLVAARYDELIGRFEDLRPTGGDDALFAYIELVNEWQRFPFVDPQLPEGLLPGWIGTRAAKVYTDLRQAWAKAAHDRWKEVVQSTSVAD